MLIFYIEYNSSFLRVNCSIHFTKTVKMSCIFVTFPVFWQILSCIFLYFDWFLSCIPVLFCKFWNGRPKIGVLRKAFSKQKDAEDNTSGRLIEGGIADLPLLRTLLAINNLGIFVFWIFIWLYFIRGILLVLKWNFQQLVTLPDHM